MLDQHYRRWSNIETTLGRCLCLLWALISCACLRLNPLREPLVVITVIIRGGGPRTRCCCIGPARCGNNEQFVTLEAPRRQIIGGITVFVTGSYERPNAMWTSSHERSTVMGTGSYERTNAMGSSAYALPNVMETTKINAMGTGSYARPNAKGNGSHSRSTCNASLLLWIHGYKMYLFMRYNLI